MKRGRNFLVFCITFCNSILRPSRFPERWCKTVFTEQRASGWIVQSYSFKFRTLMLLFRMVWMVEFSTLLLVKSRVCITGILRRRFSRVIRLPMSVALMRLLDHTELWKAKPCQRRHTVDTLIISVQSRFSKITNKASSGRSLIVFSGWIWSANSGKRSYGKRITKFFKPVDSYRYGEFWTSAPP